LAVVLYLEISSFCLVWVGHFRITLFDTQIQEAPAVSQIRVQFTVRRLMLVVLIVAALLTAFEAGRRWERAERADPPYAVFDAVEMESR